MSKEKIQKFVDDYINPALAGHGGHLAIEDFDAEGILHVRLSGGCQGCAASKQTLQGQVGAYLTEEFPEIIGIVDLTDHAEGDNPYYNIDKDYIKMNRNILIEDFDTTNYNMTSLFHLINAIKEKDGCILMTSRKKPAVIDISLPDLESRLRAATPISIDEPDDFLLEAIMIKLFSDKKIIIESRVTNYIIQRVNRSVSEIIRLIDNINHKSMEEKRGITIPLVNQVFKEMEN